MVLDLMRARLFMEDFSMKAFHPILKRASVLLLTLILSAWLLGKLFIPKFLNDNYWPLDVTYQSFYELDEDTADVLFLGSSHAISAFFPQVLYDETGIRSFNLSSEEQSLVVSYYWLKEALRTQHPNAVVLDTVVCFPYTETPYNCTEPSVRKALDPMKWSSVKLEAVTAIHGMDEKETLASYLFPIIRYHARWNDLSANDIRFWPKQNTSLKGYAVLSEDAGIEDYQPLNGESSVPAGMHPVMETYLTKTAELCEAEGIELILVSTPYLETSEAVHQAVSDYAQQHGLTYVDFNEQSVIEAMNFDFPNDMADAGHANTSGAEKLTRYIGGVLAEHGIAGCPDEQYEKSRAYCLRQVKNANLYRIDSLSEYLSSISPDEYLIFVTGSSGADELLKWVNADGVFAALIEDGTAVQWTEPHQEYRLKENLRFALMPGEENGSVKVHDVTYERTEAGLQIVLLDREKGYVIDHSIFDLQGKRIQ